MTDRRTITPQSRPACHRAIDEAPDGSWMSIGEQTRYEEQSSKFHAMCDDIKGQRQFAGAWRTKDQWKMLLISGHAIATKRGSEMVPGLEGEWVNLRESSASMGIKRMSSLIEYTLAWCATNNVRLRDDERAAA